MIQKVTFSQFCDSFSDTYKNNFTYAGKRALFDYLEEYEQDTGESIELDTVALCCEYSEYDTARDAAIEYGKTMRNEKHAREWLAENNTVIDVDGGGVIIQDF